MSNIQLVSNLRRLRCINHYTQQQISDRLNISRQAYSNYETGQRSPDIDTLIRLTEIYGVTLEQLIAQPCTSDAMFNESRGPYHPGMVIDSTDTVYLTTEEITLLMHYRSASHDDRRLARKVLNMPDDK